jgi:hypothetical protein
MKLSYTYLFVSYVWALPAPPEESSGVLPDPIGPPGASGSLRGSEGLVGFDSSNQIPHEPSTVIPPDQFELASGQSADPELGLYLDLTKVKNPQPIRGNYGGSPGPTDPGPRWVLKAPQRV